MRNRVGQSAIRFHYAGGLDNSENGEDDVLEERRPGFAKACKPGVNWRQLLPIGAGAALLRRCSCWVH